MLTDEEKKKREEEAKNIISSMSNSRDTINTVNYNNYNIHTNNNNEKEYINKIKEANDIINTINPREDISTSSINEDDIAKSQENATKFINLIDDNLQNDNIVEQSNTTLEQQEVSSDNSTKSEAVNVILNRNKLTGTMTDEEKLEQENIKQQNLINAKESNSDKNLLSQLGKTIENLWLGAVSGVKTLANYVINTDSLNKDQKAQQLAGIDGNSNIPTIVKEEYKNQNSKSNILNNIPNKKLYIASDEVRKQQEQNNITISEQTKQNIKNDLANYTDAYGDIELNPGRRTLSYSIAKDQNKIATNVNKISNPVLKKVSELAPSTGNSLLGAGISMVNPYLGMSYFMVSASGSYEADGRNRGMSREEARNYGMIMGWAEGATEMISIDKFLKAGSSLRKGAFKEALKNYGLDMVDNAIQEAVIDPVDELAAQLTSGKTKNDYSSEEGYKQLITDMIQDGIDGALSSLLMNGLTAGIDSSIYLYNKIQNNENITQQDIQNAYIDIQNNPNINIKKEFQDSFKYQKDKLLNNSDNVYNVLETDNEGTVTGIKQVIGEQIELNNDKLNITPVVVYNNGYYNIIDGESGTKLDTTMYNSKEEAIEGFNNKIINADNATIKNVNSQVTKSKLALIDKIQDVQEKVSQNPEAVQKQSKINFVEDNKLYSTDETKNILNKYNIDTSVSNRPYIGQEINDIINNKLSQTNEDKKSSAFYSNETNYAVNDIKKVTEPFGEKKTYTKNELADIWNDNISDNEYDVVYDSNGDIQSYIAIEEEGKNLVVNQYDNQDNVVKSEIIPENNGKYTSEAVRSTIEKVASIYDENKPINGQVDIEGNEVRENLSKEMNISNSEKNYNNFKELISTEEEKAIKNFNPTVSIQISEDLKKIHLKDIKQSEAIKIAKKVFKENNKTRTFENQETNNKIKVIADDIKESIHKTFSNKSQKKYLRESIASFSEIDSIIKNGKKVSESKELKNRSKYKQWNYYITQANIDNKPFLIEFDVSKQEDGWHLRVERLKELNIKKVDTPLAATKKSMLIQGKSTNINNSITQKTESVKSDKNTVINKDMQKEKNNTNIQDFGEKIGGARKDLSGQRDITKTNNKEVIHDYTVQNTENGYSVNFKNKTLKDGFKSQKEAEQYILDFKENIKSNMAFVEEGTNGDEKRYTIKLRNPRTLKSEYIGKVFTNKLDAESYAIALSIYLKEHGKNLFRPEIQKVERVNPNNKNATKTTGNDILNNFGFKGGEFGNWVNQTERQEFLNYAQNAFTDLAIALDIDESSLGQNNEMNIAFGARGKGLTGAVAHFEPDKHVINMTRLKGAGSLAHEYGHSIDNYLSRIGGYNDSGMVTTNSRNPKLSDNMNKAVNEVINAMNYNVSTNETEIANKNAIYEKNRKDSLQSHMGYLDRIFNGEATTYKYNRKTKQREQVPITVTEKQKQEYQRIKNTLLEGKLEGEVERKLNSSTLKVETIYPEEISTLEKMYKDVIGRKIDEDTLYWLYRYGKPSKQITSVKSESAFSKSAMELDRATGRKTRYFSKTEEMWARAFEAYVSDKLKAKGITNTYLVHSVNNNEYALFNPFPAGEERKNINKAFDNLIQIMKEEGFFKSKTKTIESFKNNNDIRYMKKSNSTTSTSQKVTDNQGRELSKQQQEYFKNSKVRDEKGNLKTVYHGTDTKFTVFNYDYLGKNGTANGKGFYLADDINVAKSYSDGKNIIEAYVDIQKPLSIGKTTITKNDYIKFLEAVNDKTNGVLFADYGDGEKIQKNSNKYKEIINQFKEEYNYGGDDVDLVLSILNSANITLEDGYRLLKNTIGYDGIIVETNYIDNGDTVSYTQYIPLTPEQIKNVDNTNPTNNKDIRFAKRSAKENNIRKQQTQRNAERSESYIEQEIQKIEKTGNWDDSIPVTKLTDIRRTLENYLGLGIQKGHFRQQAYGIYKTNRDVLRTKELKDMDTILHETGHAMDLGNRIKIDKETIADELLTAISKTGGYENESRQVQLDEGFAEIIREYSIVPDRAKAEYPQTVAVLEGIRQNDKSFDNFITKVQQQTYNYIHQNPRNRTLSNVSIGEQTDKPQLSKEYIKQEVMRNIYDKDYALKVAVNELNKDKNLSASDNAYYLTRLASGIGDKVISMLSDGYIDENGNKLMPGLNRIGEILGNDPERFNDLRAYLVAKRDVDYKAKTLKTGIRTMDSNAVIEQFKNDSQIQETSKLVYDTLDGVLQYVLNNHLIDQETADKIKESNAFYVPMQRVLGDNGNNVGRRGAVADIIKARTGSELDVKDVLENIIANSSNMIQQVENNNILRALYKEGESSGLTGAVYDVIPAPMTKIGTVTLQTWENELKNQGVDTKGLDLNKTIDLFAPNNKVDSKNKITSFIDTNGKRIYLQFYDELLFNSVMNMDKEFMSKVLKISSKLNMPLRYGATMANLGFAIPNMISDTAQATIYSTAGFIPVVDNAIGIIDVLAATNKTAMNFLNKVAPQYAEKINAMYTLYQQTGATSATRMSQYRESTQNLMKDVYGTKDSQTLGIQEKYKPLKRLLDILTYIPELSEQSTRFRVFERNYDYYKNKGTSEMDTRIMAALESRDATQDFGRTGNLTREINKFIPFSAARVGSIYTFAEKVKANPKQVGMRIAILTAIAMAIKAIGYDDDEIEELNQRKKDDNFVLKMGDNIVTIKKPQGILRSMINLAEYIQDLFTGHIEEGKEGKRLGEWINNAIMDNMPADSITGLVPNMVVPLIENAINKDFYYNTDIVKSYDLELPDSEQYYDYNSQLAIWLGNIFNYSPAKIDNLISGYFAGLGTSVTDTMDYFLGKLGITAEQPEMGAEDNAVAKRFIVNVNSNSASIDEMYDRKTELTKKSNSEEGLTTDEKEEFERLTNATSNISKINKQIKEIKKDLTMSGKEKAEQIKLLQQQKTDMARESLKKEVLYEENKEKNASIQFYTTSDSLKKNGYTLAMTSEMKKEYEQIAYEYYSKYESQGLYSKEKLEKIESKAKDYAKTYMFSKYKSNITKSEK